MLDAQVSNLLQKIGEIFKFIGIMLQKSKFELWKKRDYGGRTITDSKHLFAQEHKKKHLRNLCKCLIFNVDQPGLEPGTSRL